MGQTCSNGQEYDSWIQQHSQDVKNHVLSVHAAGAVRKQTKVIYKEAGKEFEKEQGEGVGKINQQERIMNHMIAEMKKSINTQCGTQAFEQKAGKSLSEYFKEKQLSKAFDSFREQAKNQFTSKQKFLLNSIDKQGENFAQDISKKGKYSQLGKEQTDAYKLILKRSAEKWKPQIQTNNQKVSREFREKVSVNLLAKNLANLESTQKSGEFFDKTLKSYKECVSKVLESFQK